MLHRCRALYVSAALVVLLTAVSLDAANRGRFQGFFNFRQVSVLNDQVALTLDLRILNKTDSAVTDAQITIQDSLRPKASYSSFSLPAIASNHVVEISQAVDVPATEFRNWQRGNSPRFLISYTDSSGKTIQQPLNLVRRPLKGGN